MNGRNLTVFSYCNLLNLLEVRIFIGGALFIRQILDVFICSAALYLIMAGLIRTLGFECRAAFDILAFFLGLHVKVKLIV
jgi:hypothetical protein